MRDVPKYVPPEEKRALGLPGKEKFEAWQKENRERFDMARNEHERVSQEYLAKAEQAKTADELIQLFSDAEYWHHQQDLIAWAGQAQNQRSLDFLSQVAKDSEIISSDNEKRKKDFYEDDDYVLIAGSRHEINNKVIIQEPRFIPTNFNDKLSGDDFLVDYDEYLMRLSARALGQYVTPEFRSQAEDNVLLLLKRLESKEKSLKEPQKLDANEPEETAHEDWDYISDEFLSETFGYADSYFNATYADVIDALGKVGSEKSIKPITELVKIKPVELNKAIADSLSKISPGKAAHEMLQMMHDSDPMVKRTAAKVLYRLEFGKIGISEEGVKYLERMYDLGEYNNPDYFVNRLTADGDVGIFDENKSLIKHFNLGDLSTDEQQVKAQVLDFTYDTLFTPRPNETREERQRREAVLEEFQKKYFNFYNDKFFQETKVHFNNLSFAEQGWFLHFVTNAGEAQKQRAVEFVKIYGEEGFRTFLSLDYGEEMGERVLRIGEGLPAREAKGVFGSYNRLFTEARDVAKSVIVGLRTDFPELEFTEESLTETLLHRANDLLVECGQQMETDPKPDNVGKKLLSGLARESARERIVRSQFKEVATLLSRDKIDLSRFEQQQTLVLKSLRRNPEQKRTVFSALSQMDKFQPIPEIHWRVDRSMAEYNRRSGLDLEKFLQSKAEAKPYKPVLLEIGPGSGAAKAERAKAGLADIYQDISLSDRIYYPLDGVFEKLIDYERLQEASGLELSTEDRKQLADFLYKTAVIEPGQTGRDRFDYDGKIQHALKNNINNLKEFLPGLAERLKLANAVPSTTSSRDEKGQVIYPNKIRAADQSPAFQKAKALLEENISDYLRAGWQEQDFYELIEAFPPNVMIGDFHDIKKLLPDQIDVELGIRSTVYDRGEQYVRLLTSLMSRLAKGGVAVDDSIRDNDGWYYRIGEVWEAKKRMQGQNPEVLVVLGPGFENEDFRQDLVPLAMLVTKDGSSKELAERFLLDKYQLVDLEDLARDNEYLRSLDNTGRIADRAKEAVRLEAIII